MKIVINEMFFTLESTTIPNVTNNWTLSYIFKINEIIFCLFINIRS